MSLKCWVNKHSYAEVVNTDLHVYEGVRMSICLYQCEGCGKYKVKFKVICTSDRGEESFITLTTNGKKIGFLNGRSN